MASDAAPITSLFDAFRADLDDHNDRRERLIKVRQPLLPRTPRRTSAGQPRCDDRVQTRYLPPPPHHQRKHGRLRRPRDPRRRRGQQKAARDPGPLQGHAPELAGDRFWHYQQNVSPGLQEYIEALSFAHYLEHRSLITYAAVQRSLSDDVGGPYFPLPVSDYLLGLSDLTGELMRFAISAIAKRGGRSKASEVCAFVRGCKADFEIFTPHIRDLSKKQRVTSQSLQKIEEGASFCPPASDPAPCPSPAAACAIPVVLIRRLPLTAAYAIAVRTSEYDLPPDLLDDLVSRHVSGYGLDEGDSGRGLGAQTAPRER
ncbi:hypothetical protein EVG20_g11234 [Dentipellis fragilis]|uniref:Translin n=1 Tax=Dentipellis fragilis TaxID=205917 RepID=A0A4Y9XQZ5_9AGAM|nr:hypothetical protein EVG20_g11234 [Dentipellis fragilis]